MNYLIGGSNGVFSEQNKQKIGWKEGGLPENDHQ